MIDIYNNSNAALKAEWAGPVAHIYDYTDYTITSVINKLNIVKNAAYQAWPPSKKMIITEAGWYTGTGVAYGGAKSYSNTQQRDLTVAF